MASYFNTSPNKAIWEAIAANRLVDATTAIEAVLPTKKKSFFSFLHKEEKQPATVISICRELLKNGEMGSLQELIISMNNGGIQAFDELMCFLKAVDENNTLAAYSTTIANKALSVLQQFTADIRDNSGGYPNGVIGGGVWFDGFALRFWCEILAAYFGEKQLPAQKTETLLSKCNITCSIMSHYPHEVGPDMVACGKALEATGNAELAEKYYKAVVLDFEWIADKYYNDADEVMTGEDRVSLQSLQEAYKGVSRINTQTDYRGKIASLDLMLKARVAE
jgi:hypothetical protein